MEVFAFIGHSGTGKSHHAPVIAARFGIEYIIDDGLLIKGNMNLAGRSSKRENTRYGAIKRALFKDLEQANQVKEKVAEIKPERVLILGTSRRMADVIAQNLDLPKPIHYFTIEEVSDSESIKKALAIREKDNRHVIPLPTFAIKKDFPGYIVNPLRSFFSLPPSKKSDIPMQRSVVRPIFSRLGSFFIAEHVITELAKFIALRTPGIYKILDLELENGRSKVVLNIDLSIDLADVIGMRIDNLLREVRQSVKEEVEHQTGFYLDEVNVYAKKLHMKEELTRDPKAMRKLFTSS
ncbi:MAG: hypothetical protein R6U91_01175 [Bacillota bacterium]